MSSIDHNAAIFGVCELISTRGTASESVEIICLATMNDARTSGGLSRIDMLSARAKDIRAYTVSANNRAPCLRRGSSNTKLQTLL